jgi:hypothetical protein
MIFNEVGARDKPFNEVRPDSIFLLGDSFAEGYGVAYPQMFQTHLERYDGYNILNFGSAGNFGPLQALLIYEHFRHLPHNGIIAFFLPSNDFQDNDQEFWSVRDKKRYRPYFSSGPHPVEPFYFSEATKKRGFFSNSKGAVSLYLKENFWTSNAIRSFLLFTRGQTEWKEKVLAAKRTTAGNYYTASEVQQSNIVAAYTKLAKIAGHKKNVVIVIIPSKTDIAKYLKSTEPFIYKSMPWFKGLTAIDRQLENRVLVVDLMEFIPDDPSTLFFDCDGHWNPFGNKWAAGVISQILKDTDIFK